MKGYVACRATSTPISQNDFEKAFHWVSARTNRKWSNGQPMSPKDVEYYQGIKYPFDYGGSRIQEESSHTL